MNRIDAVHPSVPRRDLPPFRPGDTVRVHVNITEGDKQRIQVFEGVVLRRRGHGPQRHLHGAQDLLRRGRRAHLPRPSRPTVTKVEIKARGHVRRARLYYLRELRGKKARLRSKVRDVSGLVAPEAPTDEAGSQAEAEPVAADEAEAVEVGSETAPE